MFAPKGTPEAMIKRMRDTFAEALSAPDVAEKIKALDMTVVASTSAEAAQVLSADSKKWGEVARRIKLGLD